jgi:hypothetical protein
MTLLRQPKIIWTSRFVDLWNENDEGGIDAFQRYFIIIKILDELLAIITSN